MSTTLFVKASDRSSRDSVSMKLYETFRACFTEIHPDEEVHDIDLYEQPLPYLGSQMIDGHSTKVSGDFFPSRNKSEELSEFYLEQFINADRVVFGFPLWNLTIPAILHTFMDQLHYPGKTFKYTEEGDVGLLTGKKIVLLNARGGVYAENDPFEMAVSFMKTQFAFFGITDIDTVVIEGHHEFPDRSETIIEEGLTKARHLASKC
ncbi:FMN-dependent NADH-azoreductase [Salicibibacter halophilus]|uniref:FMN dependent NADH:quinone oxidoreductase n=1 Tax=Salicibibacter halophilus TaxID=2502791 RepID=A0A514LFU7_9BACI|nr:FMN-dependent NADH-azoreductase [Salicibibacter halophilus]QDI90713.1 FMN-dependent NADH-azoreductase [Salicibibacter halophilus]